MLSQNYYEAESYVFTQFLKNYEYIRMVHF